MEKKGILLSNKQLFGVPAGENMLPKPKYGWGPDAMCDKELLKQIPHFKGFFHVVILL